MSVINVLLAIAQAIPALVRNAAPRKRAAVEYHDAHHWSDYDLRGAPSPRHCVYCKQLRALASEYCPGVAK